MGDQQSTFGDFWPAQFPETGYTETIDDGLTTNGAGTVEIKEYLTEPITDMETAFLSAFGDRFEHVHLRGKSEDEGYTTVRDADGTMYKKSGAFVLDDAMEITFDQSDRGARYKLVLRAEPEEELVSRYGSEDLEQYLFDAADELVDDYISKPADVDYDTAEVPEVDWDDIVLPHQAEQQVRDAIMYLQDPQECEAAGIEPSDGALLYGPTGTGKTLLAKVVANDTDAGFFSIGANDITDMMYGASEQHVTDIFEDARQYDGDAVIFVDEAEGVFRARDGSAGRTHEATQRIVQQFLAELDGFEKTDENVMVLAATNHPDQIDAAVRGRLDNEIEIPVPDTAARKEILDVHTREGVYDENIDYGRLAERTEGFVGRDLEKMTQHAKRKAFRDAQESGEDVVVNEDDMIYGLEVMADKLDQDTQDTVRTGFQ